MKIVNKNQNNFIFLFNLLLISSLVNKLYNAPNSNFKSIFIKHCYLINSYDYLSNHNIIPYYITFVMYSLLFNVFYI